MQLSIHSNFKRNCNWAMLRNVAYRGNISENENESVLAQACDQLQNHRECMHNELCTHSLLSNNEKRFIVNKHSVLQDLLNDNDVSGDNISIGFKNEAAVGGVTREAYSLFFRDIKVVNIA